MLTDVFEDPRANADTLKKMHKALGKVMYHFRENEFFIVGKEWPDLRKKDAQLINNIKVIQGLKGNLWILKDTTAQEACAYLHSGEYHNDTALAQEYRKLSDQHPEIAEGLNLLNTLCRQASINPEEMQTQLKHITNCSQNKPVPKSVPETAAPAAAKSKKKFNIKPGLLIATTGGGLTGFAALWGFCKLGEAAMQQAHEAMAATGIKIATEYRTFMNGGNAPSSSPADVSQPPGTTAQPFPNYQYATQNAPYSTLPAAANPALIYDIPPQNCDISSDALYTQSNNVMTQFLQFETELTPSPENLKGLINQLYAVNALDPAAQKIVVGDLICRKGLSEYHATNLIPYVIACCPMASQMMYKQPGDAPQDVYDYVASAKDENGISLLTKEELKQKVHVAEGNILALAPELASHQQRLNQRGGGTAPGLS